MQIIHYPHPTLLRVAKPLKRIDAELRKIVAEMFDLMYEHRGVGLAAPQVNLPYRLFVVNETGDPKQPEHERVFINPTLSKQKGSAEDEEGCLSIPKVYAQVRRPESVRAQAYDLAGKAVDLAADGLLARVIQHENDHLDGVLFIDHLTPTGLITIKDQLEDFKIEFSHRRDLGEIPDDAKILSTLAELEKLRT
jgi:peptide deformylase